MDGDLRRDYLNIPGWLPAIARREYSRATFSAMFGIQLPVLRESQRGP